MVKALVWDGKNVDLIPGFARGCITMSGGSLDLAVSHFPPMGLMMIMLSLYVRLYTP